MAKLLKILGRIVGSVFEWTLIFVIILAFAIRTSPVQTYIAAQATDYLSEELGAEVKIDKVHIIFLDRAALDGVLVRDEQGDTLLYAKRIIINVDDYSIRKKYYTIGSADIEEAFVHIQRSKDNVFNHAFIRDYFLNKKKKRKKNKIKFKLNQASFQNSRFRYDDNRKEKTSNGMDYFHLSASEVNGSVSKIKVVKDVITAHVDWINLKEKCGFVLRDFHAFAEVSPRGVKLKDLELKSKDSYVASSKLNMNSDHYNCFKYFVDSVSFDAQIDKSDIALNEVAYFAPILKGMNDHVRLQTEVYNKVTELKLKNFDLRFKEKTRIKGTINLDDYREFEKGMFKERLDFASVDLEELKTLKLPDDAPTDYIDLSPKIQNLKFVQAHELKLDGTYDEFVVASRLFETGLGSANINNGIKFTKNESGESYFFEQSLGSSYDVKVNSFNLGGYLNNPDIGYIDGIFFLSGEAFSDSRINFSKIEGDVNRFEYMDYPYQNIAIQEGTFSNDIFDGLIVVSDHNLQLTYDGFIDFKGDQYMNFTVDLSKALLDNINMTKLDCKLLSKLEFNLKGNDMNSFDGSIEVRDLEFEADGELISVDHLNLNIDRTKKGDRFSIESSIGTALIEGKVNFNHLMDDLNYQLSRVFPALYMEEPDKMNHHGKDHFSFAVQLEDANNFLKIFYPIIEIAPKSTMHGHYHGEASNFDMTVNSNYVRYEDLKFEGLNLHQVMDSTSILATYYASSFNYGDSIRFEDVNFKTSGGRNELFHNLSWEQGTNPTSLISWETTVSSANHFKMLLNPSYYFVDNKRWDIAHESSIMFDNDTIAVDDFELTREDQYISINGQISDNRSDKLNFNIRDLKLGEISNFITTDYPLTGIINSTGFVSNPFQDLGFRSEGSLTEFTVKGQKVGDIQVQTVWNKKKEALHATGDLTYIDEKTFDFEGDYFVNKEEDNLDFNLNFDYTDLQFTNAFMDPDVLSEIRGLLYGWIHLSGTPEAPILDGDVALAAGSAYMDMLGIHIGIDGEIEVDEYGFYINGIPVFDEEGNSGQLVGAVFHENFKDFNFDLQFDLESNMNVDPLLSPGEAVANKFQVMNLPYSPDVLYYGKGYATGIANIFGYTDNLEITVDFKTEEGTAVNIPMYGIGEIEDEGFITFIDHSSDTTAITTTPKFDFTGVDLDLNFEVTPSTEINIIFNEDLGDVISAKGTGDIAISLDNLGDVKMEGVYTVDRGVYNFAMDPINKNAIAIKQKFIIEEGGSISWKGDPYDADLNLRTYYTTNANIAEISNDQFGSGTGAHQPVLSYLDLSGTMTEPAIGFDIKAPEADELARSLINRVTSDPDELNRQFFSLMLFRRFQPIDAGTAGGSGALGLIANQINYMLASVSSEYNLNLDFDSDQITGDNTLEFGITKGFLDDRLILSGSFGIENYGEDAHITDADGNELDGQLVGDVKIEYLLNESGSFRVNIFNESTDKTVIQEAELAPFTQGAGLHYKEDFNTFKDFKLIQYVFDVFRKKGNKRFPDKRKRQQRAVPDGTGIEESSDPKPVIENN